MNTTGANQEVVAIWHEIDTLDAKERKLRADADKLAHEIEELRKTQIGLDDRIKLLTHLINHPPLEAANEDTQIEEVKHRSSKHQKSKKREDHVDADEPERASSKTRPEPSLVAPTTEKISFGNIQNPSGASGASPTRKANKSKKKHVQSSRRADTSAAQHVSTNPPLSPLLPTASELSSMVVEPRDRGFVRKRPTIENNVNNVQPQIVHPWKSDESVGSRNSSYRRGAEKKG